MIFAYAISSSGASHDQQASDALDYLRLEHPAAYADVRREFPETLRWNGAWIDTAAMEVHDEWSSWLTDAIESTDWVQWHDGEPYAMVQPIGRQCAHCGEPIAVEDVSPTGWHRCSACRLLTTPDVVYSDGAIVDASDHHPDCLCDDCEAERED